MARLAVIVCLLASAAAQQAPIPDTEVPQRKELLRNQRVTVSAVELAAQELTPMHRHERDLVTVFVSGGNQRNTMYGGKPVAEKVAPGEVRFRRVPFAHSTQNIGPGPFRVTFVEFADPQGEAANVGQTSRYCNPGSTTACVEEKQLFCTAKVCVEDVTFGPGAVSTKHTHPTDHMLIAISDYELRDAIERKGTVMRNKKSGEAEYIAAGITHQLTNVSRSPARFIVIVWR